MRISVASHDYEVAAGTPLSTIMAFAADADAWAEFVSGPVWCGDIALAPGHRAGVAPLLHGARLTSAPGLPSCVPVGPHLAVISGPDAGLVLPLRNTVSVGRAPECDLVLDDPALSRAHLRWEVAGVSAGSEVRVVELGSTNGTTYTIGSRTRRLYRGIRIPAGAVVEAGRTRIQLRQGAGRAGVTDRPGAGTRAAPQPALPEVCGSAGRAPALGRGAIAVLGEERWAQGFARAVLLERGTQPAAGQWREPWMRWLAEPSHGAVVVLPPNGVVPPEYGTVVRALANEVVVETGEQRVTLPPVCVSPATAEAAARRLAAASAGSELPAELTWGDLAALAEAKRATGTGPLGSGQAAGRLRPVAIGLGARGPVTVDLDAHGPHLLVAGAAGSGVTTLLHTLVGAIAHEHSPRELALAVFDFGSAGDLAGYVGLPHVRGFLQARDGARARVALDSLAREVESRRAGMSAAGCTLFDNWHERGGAPPRLGVIVNEFQSITAHDRDFVPRLIALAAAGAALGVHVVIATQRPAGAVTPQVRALVGTTIALRVLSEAESRDLIGTAHATRLPASTPGRAILANVTARESAQIALPLAAASPAVRRTGAAIPRDAESLASRVAARWGRVPAAPPLW